MTTFSNAALRAVALRTQNLHTPNGNSPTPTREILYGIIQQIGCLQIDTLQMVARSQYLTLWSRLGAYDPKELDALLFGSERKLFEGWQHAACIIPLTEYRYQMPRQRDLRENPNNWYTRWLTEKDRAETTKHVLESIRREGARKIGDFERGDHPAGAWWNWRPAKVALESLYAFGELMIANRVNFQRVYDLTERVLPKWADTTEPTAAERDRFWVERGAKALGVCTPRHAGDYTWMKVTRSRPCVESLLKDGTLVPITGRLANKETAELIVHRDNLSLLEQAADRDLRAERTTFLSPFDSLWWATRRDEQFWGFHQSIEAYLPAPKRVYGYFCLPILHKDRLVSRFDPKLDRKNGTLILRTLYLEPHIRPTEELVHDLAGALKDFMSFHKAKDLVVEASQPDEFGKKLLKKM